MNIRTFSAFNDSDKAALIIDDKYQLFSDKNELIDILKKAEAQFELYHSSINVLEPHSGSNEGDYLSHYQQIDLKNYVDTRQARCEKRGFLRSKEQNTLPVRFAKYKNEKESQTYNDNDYSYLLDDDFDSIEDIFKRAVHGVDFAKYTYQ